MATIVLVRQMVALSSQDVLDLAMAANGHTTETTVLVAVSSGQVREALVAMIGALDGFQIVGEAQDMDEALGLARRARPTLALVDQELPHCGGAWTIESLVREGLVRGVVAMGLRADTRTRERAVAAGAGAFVQVGATPAEVQAALEGARERALHTPILHAHGTYQPNDYALAALKS